jgi:Flp pilus assembly protein TadG
MARRSNKSGLISEAGTVALEYGFLLPPLIVLLMGGMDVSRLIWTHTTLHRAVEAAARCGAVNETVCGSASTINAHAVAQAWGLSASPSVFTVDVGQTAITVTANYDFTVVVPFVGEPSDDNWFLRGTHRITVSARYPRKQ